MEVTNQPEKWNQPKGDIPVFKVDPIIVLLLSYWNIKVAEVINAVSNKEIVSTPVAVFSGCCLPVNLYFYYVIGKEGLPNVYRRTGELDKDQSTLLLILGFFFPFAAAMIVQGDINRLY